jgi:hypothetical protein
MAARAPVLSDERRFFGIERRTIVPALVVLGLAAVMSLVLPSIDSEASYRDQVHKGDIAEIADGITLVPASGWDLARERWSARRGLPSLARQRPSSFTAV